MKVSSNWHAQFTVNELNGILNSCEPIYFLALFFFRGSLSGELSCKRFVSVVCKWRWKNTSTHKCATSFQSSSWKFSPLMYFKKRGRNFLFKWSVVGCYVTLWKYQISIKLTLLSVLSQRGLQFGSPSAEPSKEKIVNLKLDQPKKVKKADAQSSN